MGYEKRKLFEASSPLANAPAADSASEANAVGSTDVVRGMDSVGADASPPNARNARITQTRSHRRRGDAPDGALGGLVSAPTKTTPGETTPGEATPGETIPGEATPGEATPGEATPGEAISGKATPGEAIPGEVTLGNPVPGDLIPGNSAPGGLIAGVPSREVPSRATPSRAKPGDASATFKDRSARRWKAVAVVLALLAVVAIAVAAWFAVQAQSGAESDPGAYVIPQGDMTDEEARALIDDVVESSRITISVAATMELSADGQLRVNFIVPEPNNGLSERLEVEQNGRIIYRSGVVAPGYMIEWGEASQAVAGSATATVYAVNESGGDSGNPTSVEVEIVETGKGAVS